jgi:hypothetical protein
MSRVVFDSKIPVSERAKAMSTSDRAATLGMNTQAQNIGNVPVKRHSNKGTSRKFQKKARNEVERIN